MTFTTFLKEEISKNELSPIEGRFELEAFIKCIGKVSRNEITITLENPSVARKIFKEIKEVFNITPSITVRIQKRFRVKQIYIITIKERLDFVKESFSIGKYNTTLDTVEERTAFLEGAFLAVGNISNPQTSGYHLEYICNNEKMAKFIQKNLISFGFNAKVITRRYKEVVYLKAAENISDLLKLFKATNSMFFLEDTRIYRDHKNMVNRLNNCEISNQTKAIETGQKQLRNIEYIEKHDLISLLDDKQKIVIEARSKYPESSLTELAEIITIEYGYKIGKSGINHHFIKLNNMVENHKENNKE